MECALLRNTICLARIRAKSSVANNDLVIGVRLLQPVASAFRLPRLLYAWVSIQVRLIIAVPTAPCALGFFKQQFVVIVSQHMAIAVAHV